MAKLVLNTAPSGDVVTVEELKANLRVDDTDEDVDVLPGLLASAVEAAEGYTWRKLLTQTWDQYFDDWEDPMELAYGPVSSIDSVTYTDELGASQTLGTDIYELGQQNGVPIMRRKYNQDWPTVRDHPDVIKVTFICGYGAASAVPDRIKRAIKLHASHHFLFREGQPMPRGFNNLLNPYSVRRWKKIKPNVEVA